MSNQPIRIAMWSGPRNLSTAMMRSFGARADTSCVDEPFYAPYLKLTGLDHPMRAEILAAHDCDPKRVAHAMSTGRLETPIQYQKHMTHHMVDGVPRDWFGDVRHAFLIRHPARVLASYAKKVEAVSLEAIGFTQQAALYDAALAASDRKPIIVDCDQILAHPKAELTRLCLSLDIPFDPAMLAWTAGPKPEDGAWAPHWYDAVNSSTGFSAPPKSLPELPAEFTPILDAAMPIYTRLYGRI